LTALSGRGPDAQKRPRIHAHFGEFHRVFWPKDTAGCGAGTFTIRINSGMVSIYPLNTYWDQIMDPTSNVYVNRHGVNFSFGEDSCKILMWIDTGRIQTAPDVKAE
jgi:hypothetical protein